MGDRLDEIKQMYTAEELAEVAEVREASKAGRHVGSEAKAKMYVSVLAAKLLHAHRDIAWLVAEVERLASLRDHPGGVDPQTGSEK